MKPALASSTVYLERALTELAGPAVVLDEEHVIRASNAAARALLGSRLKAEGNALATLFGRSADDVAEALKHEKPVDRFAEGALNSIRVRASAFSGGTLLFLTKETVTEDNAPHFFHGMWTRSPNMRQVFRMVERVAADNETVLVRGDTGTGKELIAHAIHALSARAKGPFRAINCAALPANLLESELFGHARGAFTGALKDTLGHVQLAHRGTLFLDEVAELPLELQAKLLRVLETHSVVPVGARDPIPVDVRIVSATHRALRKEVEAGRFRADLMYRLRVIPIFLPTLREREGDISLLTEKLLAEMNPTRRRTILQVAPAAMRILEGYSFPGNVRELRNVLSFAYAMGDGPVLLPSDLPPELIDPASAPEAPGASDPAARVIVQALARAKGNRHAAAAELGMSRITLWRRMRELGLLKKEH